MLRLALIVAVLAAGAYGQERDQSKPPRTQRPAAWSSQVRSRLAEAKAALDAARNEYRARLEETRAVGSRRKPR